MSKTAQVITALSLVLFFASAASAQPTTTTMSGTAGAGHTSWIDLSGALGAGLVVIGAAAGIGRLAASAVESMARQPEVAGTIQTAMIIAAALIEGFTFYALFICSTQNPWPVDVLKYLAGIR